MKDLNGLILANTASDGVPTYIGENYREKTTGLPEITNNKNAFLHLKERRMKLRLLEALKIRNLDILHKVLADATDGEYADRMGKEYEDGLILHGHLSKLSVLQHEIASVSRYRLSEILGFSRPPESLLKLLQATLVILGEPITELTWDRIRTLTGRSEKVPFVTRVERFNVNNLSPELAADAREVITLVDLKEIDNVSNIASKLYAWVTRVLIATEHISKIKTEYFPRTVALPNYRNRRRSNFKDEPLNKRPALDSSSETFNDEKNFGVKEEGQSLTKVLESIKKLTRGQLSEVQGYGHPPTTVQKVMKATFRVLGENPTELDWKRIRTLLGKIDNNSIMKRVGNFRIRDVESGTKEYVEEALDGLTLNEVRSVSNVAAIFFTWVKCVMKNADNPQRLNNTQTFVKDPDPSTSTNNKVENNKPLTVDNEKKVKPDIEKELLQFQKEITKMTRVRITEVHSYSNPPAAVEKVMKAIFTILGEPLTDLTWKKLRGLMSRMDKNSLTKRIESFQVRDLTPEAAKIADQFLDDLTFQKVQSVSNVAATFFAWAKYVLSSSKNNEGMQNIHSSTRNVVKMGLPIEREVAEEDSEEEMIRVREEITKMSRGRISEIHAYSRPPLTIEKVMKAVFTILGESPGGLDWKRIRGLMCRMDKNSLIRRVDGFQISDLTQDAAETADLILSDLTLQSVKSVSNVAATLYAWAKCVVKDLDQQSKAKAVEIKTETPESQLSRHSDSKMSSNSNSSQKYISPIKNTNELNVPDNSEIPILTKAQILRTASKRRKIQHSPTSDSSSTKTSKRVTWR